MKNQKANKLPRKEEKQKSYEEKRIQAFRQFIAAHLREMYLNDRFNALQTKSVVN